MEIAESLTLGTLMQSMMLGVSLFLTYLIVEDWTRHMGGKPAKTPGAIYVMVSFSWALFYFLCCNN